MKPWWLRGCRAAPAICQVADIDLKDRQVVFQCAGNCKKIRHYKCVGYVPELSALPVVICPTCLKSLGDSTGTAGVALSNRRMLEIYVEEGMKFIVWKAKFDGSCLLRCVARAVDAQSLIALFREALRKMDEVEIPEAVVKDAVLEQCTELLAQETIELTALWNSKLFDYLPQALAIVTAAPCTSTRSSAAASRCT
jgi:hypothetical protein